MALGKTSLNMSVEAFISTNPAENDANVQESYLKSIGGPLTGTLGYDFASLALPLSEDGAAKWYYKTRIISDTNSVMIDNTDTYLDGTAIPDDDNDDIRFAVVKHLGLKENGTKSLSNDVVNIIINSNDATTFSIGPNEIFCAKIALDAGGNGTDSSKYELAVPSGISNTQVQVLAMVDSGT